MKLCECGCGEEVPYTSKRRKDDQPKFRQGHATRLRTDIPRYIPTPEEVPSGLCECGCGKPTPITKENSRRRRLFPGYPAPRLRGHTKGITKRREASHKWKGGRLIAKSGHVKVYRPEHPMAGTKGYIFEHRLVMSEHLGRSLGRHEIVHHKNGDPSDNRLKNLELMTRSEHIRHHNLEEGRVPPWIAS